jgi:lysophospholipase L1-like esterase
MKKRLLTILFLCLAALVATAQTAYDFSKLKMEDLGRGVVAVRKSPTEVFVTWRYLSQDPANIKFNVFRDGVKVNPKPIADVTFFVDANASAAAAAYEVRPASGAGKSGRFVLPAGAPEGYIPIPIQAPFERIMPNGERAVYTANDCSVGDVDGDGEYEFFIKWDPSNSHDNAHNGYTGEVYIDCIKLTGERLWRVDLGRNIRAGAHYTQFIVYDLDGDGCAEMVCKTSDATKDGTGKVIGDPDADYREHKSGTLGRIMKGNEYLTVFNGRTGAAMATVDYVPGRGENGSWGDRNANRSDRYLATVAYLDGSRPSAVMCRGYYTRATLAAWDWDGKELKLRWFFDSHSDPSLAAWDGQGNHNLRAADVDGDGSDEIIYGSCCIDNDGTGLYSNGLGHGDAMHLGAMIPGSPKLQVWIGHETRGVGSALVDAATGKIIYRVPSNTDVGRSMAIDADPTNPGWEMWTSASGGMRNYKGDIIGPQPNSVNFAVWWDGDLSRELMDRTHVQKLNPQTKAVEVLQEFEGTQINNGTKSNPAISGDLYGDWREEVLLRSADGKELRLYVSTIPTKYRFHTFLEDPVYRTSIATENVCYNQPPETGFYFGEELNGKFRGTTVKGIKVKEPQYLLTDVLLDSVIIGRQRMQTVPQGPVGNPNGTPDRPRQGQVPPQMQQGQRPPQGAPQGQRPPQGPPQQGQFTPEQMQQFMQMMQQMQQGQNPQGQRPPQGQNPQGQRPPQAMRQDNSYRDNTPDSLDLAKTARPVAGSSRKGNNPVLFLVGDSTTRTGTRGNGDNGQWGWGYYAQDWFDADRLTVENHALGGLSCRTFYRDWWPDVIKGVEKGDYVIIQIGHNDSGPYDTPFGRSSIPGSGKETVQVTGRDGKTETVLSYGEYLRRYIDETRAKGATPILSTLTPRNQWDDGKVRRKNDSYNIWIREVAAEKKVPVIDLEDISARDFESWSKEKVNYMFYNDNIHSSAFGAAHNAYCMARGIADCQESDLKKYLKSLELPNLGIERESGKPALIVTGDSTIKNSDNAPDGMWGWGSVLETIFDPARINLVNAGLAGRSARTFLDEGRWDRVYNSIRPGDFVVIQFGHNDFGPINQSPFRAEIPGNTDENENFFMPNTRKYQVIYTYGWYLRKFIDDVREKGGTPILVSVTPRNEWPDGKIERRDDFYGIWLRDVVKQTGVDYVDMHNISADFFDSIGQEATKSYYKNDHTHTSRKGAERNATSFAEGLRKINHPLAKYLK